jgi:hypothetical protein
MALGEKVGETSGRVTGTRVITPSGTQPVQLEVSIQGNGKVLGEDVTEIGTYVQTLRPGGVLYGEGDVLYITDDDETAHWRGFGVGRPVGPFPAGHFAVCGSSESDPPPQQDCHRHRIRCGREGQLPRHGVGVAIAKLGKR